MNNQQIPIADQLTKIIGWRKINDHIRQTSSDDFWNMPPVLKEELGVYNFSKLVEKIKATEEFGTPDFAQCHSGGEIEFKGKEWHWEIFYIRTTTNTIYARGGEAVLNPLELSDTDNFQPKGWIELLGDWDDDHDPFPF